MGINPNALRFLARERKKGTKLGRTAMIGRQGVHLGAKDCLRILNHEFRLSLDPEEIEKAHALGFADDLLKTLGADSVDSFDYSDYEGATYTHDFNTPVGEEHKDQYDFLIDGGTLEHVFQFPTALKSCMEMLRVGGVYFGVSPANNEMGHGFYQFSPEIYFRAFSKENGFKIDDVFLYEGRESKSWYRVTDPDHARKRAEKVNTHSTYLLVRATKIEKTEIFRTPPLQPDYVSTWASSIEDALPDDRVATLLPVPVKRLITITRVRFRQGIRRLGVHLGINPDPDLFQRFDPKSE